MSPLQYQKRLRLQEARRLMLGEGLDAAEAGFRVGYESPSQFSREYSRLFGAPLEGMWRRSGSCPSRFRSNPGHKRSSGSALSCRARGSRWPMNAYPLTIAWR